ncbi:MAG: PP2C family protein-serine/threonine phosphatase, partial [Gallionellaceae bacterium]
MELQEALQIVSQTHPGMVRSHNEDSVAYDASCGFAVLADGMGGYNAGEVASGIVISVMTAEIKHRLERIRPDQKGANGEDLG